MVDSVSTQLGLAESDTSLLVLPLFHCNGLVVGVLSVLQAGGSVVVGPRFDPATFWEAVESHRPTFFSAVPTMYALLESKTHRQVDTSSLRFVVCGAAPMSAELISRFERRFSVPVVEGYGLSEGTVASTLNPVHGPRKAGHRRSCATRTEGRDRSPGRTAPSAGEARGGRHPGRQRDEGLSGEA